MDQWTLWVVGRIHIMYGVKAVDLWTFGPVGCRQKSIRYVAGGVELWTCRPVDLWTDPWAVDKMLIIYVVGGADLR